MRSCSVGVETWVEKWFRRIVGAVASGSGAASSHEEPPVPAQMRPAPDQEEEDREDEENRQNEEDEDLFKWHQAQSSRNAQREDRAAVLAHMGWTTRTTRKRWLTVDIQAGQEQRRLEVPMRDGEMVRLSLQSREQVEQEYSYKGQPQPREEATRRIRESMEAHYIAEVEREESQQRPKERRVFNAEDPDLRPYHQQWEQGLLTWEQLVAKVGVHAARFIRVSAEINAGGLSTQVLEPAATQLYEGTQPEGIVHPDEAETVPFEPESDNSTVPAGRATDST